MLVYNMLFGMLVLNLKIKKKFLRVIIIIILILLSTFRANHIGKDTVNYIKIFNMLKVCDLNEINMEIGYKILNKIVIFYNQNEIVLFFIINLIIFYFFNRFIKYFSLNYELTLLIYYCFYYFNYNFNIMRQAIAFSIFSYSLIFLDKKKIFKFYIFVILAALFHYMSLTAIPLYYFCKLKIKKINQVIFFTISFFIFFYSKDILEKLAEIFPYLENKLLGSYGIFFTRISKFGLLGRVYLYSFILYLLIYYKYKLSKRQILIGKVYLYGFYISIILFNTGYIGTRLSLFYKTIDIIIWTYLLNNKKTYPTFHKLILLLLLVYYLSKAYENGNILPYSISIF